MVKGTNRPQPKGNLEYIINIFKKKIRFYM